jgi:NADPH:quinone reductase-like Zn-dependent oxidoreductase
LGASHAINYKTEDFAEQVKAVTGMVTNVSMVVDVRQDYLGTFSQKSKRSQRMHVCMWLSEKHPLILLPLLKKTGGRGMDVILDFVGGPYWERNLEVCLSSLNTCKVIDAQGIL